jgi:transposase-like protein
MRTHKTTPSRFQNETKARLHLELIRWPKGPVCPHCNARRRSYRLAPKPSKKNTHVREGVWKCARCRKQFTVRIGTVMERSHVQLSKWLLASHLMCTREEGISVRELQKILGVTYRTAKFMADRIVRESLLPKLEPEAKKSYVKPKGSFPLVLSLKTLRYLDPTTAKYWDRVLKREGVTLNRGSDRRLLSYGRSRENSDSDAFRVPLRLENIARGEWPLTLHST